jgi:hypothetical protein
MDVYLHTLAMFHCNGWGLPYAVTGVGARRGVQNTNRFILELAARERMTFACIPPTMINLASIIRPIRAGRCPSRSADHVAGSARRWPSRNGSGSAGESFRLRLTETSPFLTVSRSSSHA